MTHTESGYEAELHPGTGGSPNQHCAPVNEPRQRGEKPGNLSDLRVTALKYQ
jgi:hypothetical protein